MVLEEVYVDVEIAHEDMLLQDEWALRGTTLWHLLNLVFFLHLLEVMECQTSDILWGSSNDSTYLDGLGVC